MRCYNYPHFVDTETQKEHSQGYTASRWHSEDWNFSNLALELDLLITVFSCTFLVSVDNSAKITASLFLPWNMVTYGCLRKAFPLLKPAHLHREEKLCAVVVFLLAHGLLIQAADALKMFLKPPWHVHPLVLIGSISSPGQLDFTLMWQHILSVKFKVCKDISVLYLLSVYCMQVLFFHQKIGMKVKVKLLEIVGIIKLLLLLFIPGICIIWWKHILRRT